MAVFDKAFGLFHSHRDQIEMGRMSEDVSGILLKMEKPTYAKESTQLLNRATLQVMYFRVVVFGEGLFIRCVSFKDRGKIII